MSTAPTYAPSPRFVALLAAASVLAGCHAQQATSSPPGKWTKVDASSDTGDNGPVTFSGDWQHYGHRVDDGLSAAGSRSGHAGDVVAFHFTGTQFRLYGDVDSACGYGVVSIDGTPLPDRVDFYAPKFRPHTLVFTSPVLDDTGHTIVVQVSGIADDKGQGTDVDVDDGQYLVSVR